MGSNRASGLAAFEGVPHGRRQQRQAIVGSFAVGVGQDKRGAFGNEQLRNGDERVFVGGGGQLVDMVEGQHECSLLRGCGGGVVDRNAELQQLLDDVGGDQWLLHGHVQESVAVFVGTQYIGTRRLLHGSFQQFADMGRRRQ